MEAIILAGGFGTRLKEIVQDIPKPMADINGKPFLKYLFNHIIKQGVNAVILSVGYKYGIIQEYFGNSYKNLKIEYSVENDPLGTGGAIKKALNLTDGLDIFILNGDTFFDIDFAKFKKFHIKNNSDFSLALKTMKNFDRYGTVNIDKSNKVIGFEEKQHKKSGFINGGLYLLNKNFFDKLNLSDKFSFEKDFIEKYYSFYEFYGTAFDNYFIDIGIPEDYFKAKELLKFSV